MTITAAPPSYALLADGTTVEIRVAGPDDCNDVREMHAQMSPDNAYLRFFSLSALAPEREAERLCRPAGPDHAALIARLGGELVGVASYEPTRRPGVAEIAFAVRDDMNGRGIATLLLEHLVSLAPAARPDRLRWRDATGEHGDAAGICGRRASRRAPLRRRGDRRHDPATQPRRRAA